jgi:catechol 2,3-dioxygenase-like lactoylglutathione lyase family enzyme
LFGFGVGGTSVPLLWYQHSPVRRYLRSILSRDEFGCSIGQTLTKENCGIWKTVTTKWILKKEQHATMSTKEILKLEVVVVPVSDVDRAKKFYASLGWRLDADFPFDNGFRVVQFTPPGSGCSVQFGANMTPAAPGSAHGLYLVVTDIEAARDELVARGAEVSEVFHAAKPGAQFQTGDVSGRVSGPAPGRATYSSFATFRDPDGNGWLLQEVTTRLPGRIDPAETTFASAVDLANALRRAEAAHGRHEARIGQGDANWPDWYAKYMVAEQAGTELPT